jgi:hypothetical protein
MYIPKFNYIDGFIFGEGVNRDVLKIQSDKISETIKYINDKIIKKIYILNNISDIVFFDADNLDFLSQTSNIEEININHNKIVDCDGIYLLSNLRRLIINDISCKIDLNRLKSLDSYFGNYNYIIIENGFSNLKILFLSRYRSSTNNLNDLKSCHKIEEFSLTQSNINSLEGLNNMVNLKSLELNYLAKLNDIFQLSSCTDLEYLHLDHCKKVKDIEKVLPKLKKLKKLFISDCGTLPNLKWLNELPNLRFFTFVGTNIEDGDLSPLLDKNFEHVGFDNKKHYSHKMTEINGHYNS